MKMHMKLHKRLACTVAVAAAGAAGIVLATSSARSAVICFFSASSCAAVGRSPFQSRYATSSNVV